MFPSFTSVVTGFRQLLVSPHVPDSEAMRNQIGFLLQFAALVFLPLLIIWQLNFGFPLVWMPLLTVAGLVVFYAGHLLRAKSR